MSAGKPTPGWGVSRAPPGTDPPRHSPVIGNVDTPGPIISLHAESKAAANRANQTDVHARLLKMEVGEAVHLLPQGLWLC